MTAAEQAARKRPLQTPACDRCTQGVMDASNPHLLGTCGCPCHKTPRPRPDFDPRVDYPERYTEGTI